MDDAVIRTRRAAEAIDPVLRSITPDQFGQATPCHDWDLRALLDHLFSVLHRWAARVERRDPPDGLTPLATAHDDVAAAWVPARDALLAAISEPGAMDREIALPTGSTGSARYLVAIAPIELMLHGWDAARSIGAGTDLDPELAGELLTAARGFMEGRPRGAAFGEEQPAPAGATAADRLAAFYGRSA